MEIFSHKDRVDKKRRVTINREVQRELFDTLEYFLKCGPGRTNRHNVSVNYQGPDDINIECGHNGFGNELFHVELSGWEIATICECMVPHPDNDFQQELKQKLQESIGHLAFLFLQIEDQQGEYKRETKFVKKCLQKE